MDEGFFDNYEMRSSSAVIIYLPDYLVLLNVFDLHFHKLKA